MEHEIILKLDDAEYAQAEEAAHFYGMTVEEWVKAAILGMLAMVHPAAPGK